MRKFVFVLFLIGVVGLLAMPCLAAEEKAAPAPAPKMGKGPGAKMAAAKAPVVKLERVDIANIQSFYLDPKERKGAVMNLAFIFALENPNNFRVMLDDLKFTVAFEEFELNTVIVYEDNYIPAKTTDYLRVNAFFDSMAAFLTLAVTKGHRLVELGKKPDEMLKKWWEEIQDFKFPITINGTATFVGPDGKSTVVPFESTFPPKQ